MRLDSTGWGSLSTRNCAMNLNLPIRISDICTALNLRRIVDFTVEADRRMKLKGSEKRDKYRELARELKELLNMKVALIQTKIGKCRTIPKALVKGH